MSNSTVEQELWNIFTFYTLHGNPMYPDLLKASQFVKLSRECNIIKSKGRGNGVTQADVNVVYIIEVKRRDRGFARSQAQMTYNDFLNALMRLSSKVYPNADTVDDAFQQLLMENVLPLASRRSPDPAELGCRLGQDYPDGYVPSDRGRPCDEPSLSSNELADVRLF